MKKFKGFPLFRKITLTVALIVPFFTLVSFNSYAIKLSTYRISLEPYQRTESFVIYNPDAESQECELKIIHYNIDESGKMTLHTEAELPDNSAKKWIRYSPRTFTLTGTQAQTVRFTLRRKANTEPAEYRSYLSIDCEGLPGDKDKQLSIVPKLIVNIPIVVRTGELQAKASIEQVMVKGNQLDFSIIHEGNRSLYGDLTVINKNNDKVLVDRPGISIYPETNAQTFSFGINEENNIDDLMIRYKERSRYGGDILLEKHIKDR